MTSPGGGPATGPAVPTEERAEVVRERIGQVQRLVADRDASGILLSSRAAFAWLTLGGINHVVAGSETGAVPLLVTHDGCFALAPANEAPRIIDEELAGLPVEVVTLPWHDPASTDREARRRTGDDPLDEAALSSELVDLRLILNRHEQERMRWLGRRCEGALDDTLSDVRRGTTEYQVAAGLEARLASAGLRLPVILVAADERIARYRHPLPKGQRVERRVMVVIVGEAWGLHVAATRILELEPPDADLQRRIEATDRVLEAMRAATTPGRTLGQVFDAARTAYAAEGHPEEWTLHHQGGPIGYQGRERIATPGDQTLITEGMAVAWNPSITGAKAEATDLVGPSGLERILD